MTTPRLIINGETMKKDLMYSTHAKAYENAISDNIFNAKYDRPSLLSLLDNIEGDVVLDMGCGPGIYAEILIQKGAEVTAIDFSSEMISIVTQKLGKAVTCYTQNLEAGLPQEKTGKFDVIISALAIHYIKNWQRLLDDIHRVLKDSGVFIFSTHHPFADFKSSPSGNYFKTELMEQTWNTIGKPVEVSFYRRPLSQIFSDLKNAGLVVTKLTEGTPTPELNESDPEIYNMLNEKPFFMFFKCEKYPINRKVL